MLSSGKAALANSTLKGILGVGLLFPAFGGSPILNLESSSGQSRHTTVEYAFARTPVLDLLFLSETDGWLLADKKGKCVLYHTTDGGRAWGRLSCPAGLIKLSFVSTADGWGIVQTWRARLSPHYFLVRTSDGGESWTRVADIPDRPENDSFLLTQFQFVDRNVGFFLVQQSLGRVTLLSTFDGGRTFADVKLPDGTFTGFFAGSSERLWVYGNDAIVHSTDYGHTWHSQLSPGALPGGLHSASIVSVSFRQDGSGLAIAQSGDHFILQSSDSGKTWKIVYESKVGLSQVLASQERRMCALDGAAAIICTRDGGSSWIAQSHLPPTKKKQSSLFTRLVLLDSGKGWAVRAGGFLYQTLNGGASWSELDPSKLKISGPN